MQLREVMNTPVVTVRASSPTDEVAAVLVSNGFAAVPVVDDNGVLVGIVDEADLVRSRVLPEGGQLDDLPVPHAGDVMTTPVLSSRPEDDVADVAALMLDQCVRAVAVVHEGRPIGIITRRDVLRAVAQRRLGDERIRAHRW